MDHVAELAGFGRVRVLVERLAATYAARVVGVTVLGAMARLLFLAHQPLWRDEAFTAVVAGRPLGQMLDAVRADSAPPLAYLVDRALTHVWASPAALRLPSALAGIAAIPLGAALCRRIAGERGGIVAALVLALAPAMVLSARDARMYALALTLVLASTLLLWRAVERPSPARFAMYALASVAALYTDYFAVLGVVGQLVALAVLRVGWRRLLLAGGCAAVAALSLVPWLIAASGQLSHSGAPFWVPPLGIASVGGELVQFLSGPPVDPWVPAKPLLQVFQGFAVAAGALALFALVRRRGLLSASGARVLRYCGLVGGAGVLVLLAVSVWRPLVDGRYASVVWGALFVAVATGLVVARSKPFAAGALGIMAATSFALGVAPTHPDTDSAVRALERSARADDFVAANPTQYLLFLYYGDSALLARTRVVSVDVPWFWGTAAYPRDAVVPMIPPSVVANHGNIYYAYQPGDPGLSVPAGYSRASTRCWTGVCVDTYRRQ